METEVNTENNVTNMKKESEKETLTLTAWEAINIERIIASQSSKGSGIKDLRMIKRVRDKLNSKIPERPTQQKPEYKDPQNPTEEEKKRTVELQQQFQKDVEEYINQEFEFDFSWQEMALIKERLKNFNGYPEDSQNVDRFVQLFDKLGIEG